MYDQSGLHWCKIDSPSNTLPSQIQDGCSWNSRSTSGRFIVHPKAVRSRQVVFQVASLFLFCSLYLSLRSLNESNILPTTHLFTSSSKNLLLLFLLLAALMTLIFFCLCPFLFSVLLYFHHVYFFLDLVFSLTFQTVWSVTFLSRLSFFWSSPFVRTSYRKWFGSSDTILGVSASHH